MLVIHLWLKSHKIGEKSYTIIIKEPLFYCWNKSIQVWGKKSPNWIYTNKIVNYEKNKGNFTKTKVLNFNQIVREMVILQNKVLKLWGKNAQFWEKKTKLLQNTQ